MFGYLTPNTPPADTLCRVLFIPNDLDWLANVTGALQLLTFPESFVAYGTATPQETADAYAVMFDLFSFNQGACRMIGEIVTYAGATSPDPIRWLACDGTSVLRSDYPDLFAVVGTTYGSIDGSHFNLPDLRGRVIVDAGSGPGLTPRSAGDIFGEETHVITSAESASHSHTDTGHTHTEGNATPTAIAIGPGVPAPSAIPTIGVTGIGNAALSTSGGDGAHNNIQPSLVLTYFIVALQ